jgi:hypothetical protein
MLNKFGNSIYKNTLLNIILKDFNSSQTTVFQDQFYCYSCFLVCLIQAINSLYVCLVLRNVFTFSVLQLYYMFCADNPLIK